MKIVNLLIVVVVMTLICCKKQKNKEEIIVNTNTSEENDNNESLKAKTYAEISIKDGGRWIERKYEGGVFKNVNTLKVPEAHTDHSYYIRYEGPGWESNKVGYRLYLDWRNGIDIFGKQTDEIILPYVGQDGFDSYHEVSDWGVDVLKVGKGLGIGSIGRLINNKMNHFNEVDSTLVSIENSKLFSSVEVNYYGWKTNKEITNLQSLLTIAPDQRYTKHTIHTSEPLKGICTGIVKHNNLPLLKKESKNSKWGYIATYGEQTVIPDKLGMAIFYELSTIENVVDGEHDHLLVFNSSETPITFYFLGAWEKEKDGIVSEEEFVAYLDQKLSELDINGKI